MSDALSIPLPDFSGTTYQRERDRPRLLVQLERVRDYCADGEWHTLREIAAATAAPEASVSARLRDLRKKEFGGFNVERRYVERGLFEYRVLDRGGK